MVRSSTSRRHGTYIFAALDLHVGHTLTIRKGLGGAALFCQSCERDAIVADGAGYWTGEYERREGCDYAGCVACRDRDQAQGMHMDWQSYDVLRAKRI